MSGTPYSDAWRERTRERMAALGVDALDVSLATFGAALELLEDGEVSLEIAGVIDAHLAQLEDEAEAVALDLCLLDARIETATPNGRADFEPVKLKRLTVDLDKLADCDVVLHGART